MPYFKLDKDNGVVVEAPDSEHIQGQHPFAPPEKMDSAIDLAQDLATSQKLLDLDNIRFQLIRLEDSITFHMIERVQYPLNRKAYIAGEIQIPDSNLSLFDWMLREQERLQSLVRRYQSPDEYPFFPDVLQKPILKPIIYPRILHPNDVNANEKLKKAYIEQILPNACIKLGREERDEALENYGSSATADVTCLQALSRRVHFGKFVAESKFRSNPEKFVKLIRAGDTKGIEDAITDSIVERKVLERLRMKTRWYGADPASSFEGPLKIDADAIAKMYRDVLIPITKEIEVDYLMQRLIGTEWEDKDVEGSNEIGSAANGQQNGNSA